MGTPPATVTIRNPAEPEKAREGLFPMDADATGSFVPRTHPEVIGFRPRDPRTCYPRT